MQDSTAILLGEAKSRKLKVEILSERLNFFRLSRGKKFIYGKSTRLPFNSSVADKIDLDKGLTKMLLAEKHLPIAKGVLLRPEEINLLEEKIKHLKCPLVVKPAQSDCGILVHMRQESFSEIKASVQRAMRYELAHFNKYASGVIIEEMLYGQEYRIIVIGDKVVSVLQRIPAYVIGDGVSSLSQLRRKKNLLFRQRYTSYKGQPLSSPAQIIRDKISTDYLKKQGYVWKSIPRREERVWLRENSNISTGGEGIDCTDLICSENKALAISAARALGAEMAGVDFITKDLNKPWSRTPGCGILELNCAVGIFPQHFPHQGKARNVAGAILDHLIKLKYL